MAVEETTPAPSSTFATISTPKPYLWPASVSVAGEPDRPLPKWKSQPMTTAPTPSRAIRIFGDELFRAHARKGGVEGKEDEARQSEPGGYKRFLSWRRQPEHDRAAAEEIGGMRFERQHGARRASLARHGDGAFDDDPMPEMQAVEIADRVDRACEPVRRQHRVRGEHEAVGHGSSRIIGISADPVAAFRGPRNCPQPPTWDQAIGVRRRAAWAWASAAR